MKGIWIDRKIAKIFSRPEKRGAFTLSASHEAPAAWAADPALANPMFEAIAADVKLAERLVLMGPGVFKHHLRIYLSEQHPHTHRRLLRFVDLESAPDAEIADFLRRCVSGR